MANPYHAGMEIHPLGGHRRITIMGLGLFGGGVGAARFWARLGSDVTVTDLRDADTLAPSLRALEGLPIRYVLGRHEPEDFTQADLVVVNPAVPPENRFVQMARAAGAAIQSETALALRLCQSPTLAVTGSNGKSTTTALLGAMLASRHPDTLVGGNIGGSLLDALPDHPAADPVVLELSSFQLHYLREQRFAPDVALVTNLSPNHLDWHHTPLRYYEAKRTLVLFQSPAQWAVLNLEDPTLREWAKDLPGRLLGVGMDDPGTPDACFRASRDGDAWIRIRLHGAETWLAPFSALRLPGAHNRMNALMAAAACHAFVQAPDAVMQGLRVFAGLPHRLETVATTDGIRFVNDSISTTPESTQRGLESFDVPLVWIGGGYDKGIPFDALAGTVQARASAAVLVGATAPAIRACLEAVGGGCTILDAGTDFERAVRMARDACPQGGVVLLSPACASYDMFAHFQERGMRFAEIARHLASGGGVSSTAASTKEPPAAEESREGQPEDPV